jgi:MOSC domain-containing protein YiiM
MSMTLMSINVARPEQVAYGDSSVMTGIFKQPVAGAVVVRKLNLDGDGQADLINHGGESKAVYAYSLDHYDYWRETLGRSKLPYGQFGENLTVAGLDEAERCIGDQLQIGDALFTISQPRVPCFKLGIRFGDRRMPRMFAESLRTGFYLRVLREGTIRNGDRVHVVTRGKGQLSIRSIFDAYLKPNDRAALRLLASALEIPELSAEWHGHISQRLARRVDPDNRKR